MSGKVVPATNIYLKAAPGDSNNSIFQVFGTPTGNNLVGLVGSNYDDGARPPPYTALTVPNAASGNLKLSFFGGKSVFLGAPTTLDISSFNVSTNKLTTSVSGGDGTSFRVLVGTTDKGSNVLNNVASGADLGSLITLVSNTYYYISAYGSNATNQTASLLVSNTGRFTSDKAPAPTGVSASLVSVTGLTPTWNGVGNAATDRYMRIGSNNNQSNIADNVSVTINTAKAITLPSNVNIYMAIAIVNAKGVGEYSTFAGPYLTSKPELAPTVTPTAGTTTRITATIAQASAENGTTSFLAKCGTTTNADELVGTATTIMSGTAFPSAGFTAQPANNLIYLTVASSNSLGVGAYSTAVSYPTSLPGAATLASTTGTTSNITTRITKASGNATTGYSAVIGSAVGGNQYKASFVPGTIDGTAAITQSFETNAPTNKYVYLTFYQSNAAGNTATSTSYVSSTAAAPTSVSASGVSVTGLTPTWTDPEGDATTDYKIKLGTTSGGSDVLTESAVSKGSANSFTITSNTNIYVSIAVSNPNGVGAYGSSTSTYLTSAPPAPSITAFSLTSGPKASVTFSITGNASTATLLIGNTSGGSNVYDGTYTSGTVVDIPVQNINLYATIKVSNTLGSNSAVTGPSNRFVPMVPTGIYSTYSGAGSYTVYWTDPSDAYGTSLTSYYVVTDRNDISYPGTTTTRNKTITPPAFSGTLPPDGYTTMYVYAVDTSVANSARGSGTMPWNNFYGIASLTANAYITDNSATYCRIVATDYSPIGVCINLAYPSRTTIRVRTSASGVQTQLFAYNVSNGWQAGVGAFYTSYKWYNTDETIYLPTSFSNALSIFVNWYQSYPGNSLTISYN
jgi:hypothetical protein